MKKIALSLGLMMLLAGLMSDCMMKKGSAEACCPNSKSAACGGKMAPDAKLTCAGCGAEMMAAAARELGDG